MNGAPPRALTAIALLCQSLNIARRPLDNSLHEVDDLRCRIGEPLGETQKAKVSLRLDALGLDGIAGKGTGTDDVNKAMTKSRETSNLLWTG